MPGQPGLTQCPSHLRGIFRAQVHGRNAQASWAVAFHLSGVIDSDNEYRPPPLLIHFRGGRPVLRLPKY